MAVRRSASGSAKLSLICSDPRGSGKLGKFSGRAFEARQVFLGADEARLEPVREGEKTLGIGLPETLVVAKENVLDHLGALRLQRREETLRRADAGPGNDTLALQPAPRRRPRPWTSAAPARRTDAAAIRPA